MDIIASGYFLSDLARCLLMHEADPPITRSFLQGYQGVRPLQGDWQRLLEALTLATALWIWSTSLQRRTQLAELPDFAANEFTRFLGGEPFLFAAERTWVC